MAIGVYNIFDNVSNNLINGVILLQKIPYYNLNCLDLAAVSNCQRFIAMKSVQNVLSDIWMGKIEMNYNFWNHLKVR